MAHLYWGHAIEKSKVCQAFTESCGRQRLNLSGCHDRAHETVVRHYLVQAHVIIEEVRLASLYNHLSNMTSAISKCILV